MSGSPFLVQDYLGAHALLAEKLDRAAFQAGIDVLQHAFDSGRKIITCGNGGSALTASHYITDWNKMINLATGRKFRGISLCDNVGLVTAYANDHEFAEAFAGQLAAIVDEGDLLVAVSGSGNSPNVLRAVECAKKHGAQTLAVVGFDGGRLKEIAKHHVHLMFGHMVMKSLTGCRVRF